MKTLQIIMKTIVVILLIVQVPLGVLSAAEIALKGSADENVSEVNDLLAQLDKLAEIKRRLAENEQKLKTGMMVAAAADQPEPMPESTQDQDILAQEKVSATPVVGETTSADPGTQDIAADKPSDQPVVSTMPENVAQEPSSFKKDVPPGKDPEDIQFQTLEDIVRGLKIDQALQEAKEVSIPKNNVPAEPEDVVVEPPAPILTPEEIIRGVIKPDLAVKKIDLDFDDASLTDILLTLGAGAQLNVVMDPVLKNSKLDLHLKNVSIVEALLLIANSYDLGFKRVESSLFITLNAKLKEQNLVSKIIKLRNIGVAEAKLLIKDVIGTVSTSEEINSLIVVGTPEQVLNVEKIIKKIDLPQPQVILEAKIIEVNKDALKDIGVDWSDQITFSYQESARPAEFSNVEDSAGSALKVFSLSRSPIQFETVIKMLENQNKAKVLSNPRVTTLNNKEAQIFVGDRIPYTVTNVTGGVATTDVRWVEPGIRLIITPTIIEKDFVVLQVKPEVSFIFAFRGPSNEFPHVKTREATAYVRVKNNEPFVLGGLLNQEDKKNLYKVPFFGKLPLIGNLFNYQKSTALDTELIITVIPTIVQSDK